MLLTNNHICTVSIFGVEIAPGETKEVPASIPMEGVAKIWLEKGVISASEAKLSPDARQASKPARGESLKKTA
jgi:hypothetical protein